MKTLTLPYALLPLLAPLRERSLYAVLAIGLLLWALAYQSPYQPAFAVGGDAITGRRLDDAPFLRGVNAPEPYRKGVDDWRTLAPHFGYRWTYGDATLLLPGLGGGAWLLEVGAGSGRAGESVRSEWLAADRRYQLDIAPIVERPRTYRVLAPADANGDVALRMLTPRLETGDPRDLGFLLTSVRATPAGGMLLPALPQLGWLLLALALAHVQLRAAGLGVRSAFATSVGLGVVIAVLLATARLALTSFTPVLAGVLAGCLGLTAVLRLIAFAAFPTADRGSQTADRSNTDRGSQTADRSNTDRGPQTADRSNTDRGPQTADRSNTDRSTTKSIESDGRRSTVGRLPSARQRFLAALIGIVALAWGLRVGGLLHPQYRNSDVLLNAHKLLGFELGNVYLVAGLPKESGGGDAPYPPGTYITLAPLQFFFAQGDDGLVPLLKVGVALLDSLVAGLVGLVLWRSVGPRAALLGAALYVAPPPLLNSFSVGEFANIGGQALALPALVSLALAMASPKAKGERQKAKMPEPFAFCLLPFALVCVGLLAHLGVAISLVCALAGLWLVRLVEGLRRGYWRPLVRLTLVGLLAAAFVAACYYSAPKFMPFFATRLAGGAAVPAPEGETPLGRLLGALGVAINWRGKIVPPLLLAGALGLALLLARRNADGLRALALAWWLGTLLSLGLLLVARQGVRWDLFLFPALCLCGGVALDALWRRGRSGRWAALAATLFPICYGIAFWVALVRDNYH